MRETEKSEDVTKTPSEKNSPKTREKSNSTSDTSSDTGEEKKEGDEFIREGHGHDYSMPVAGEGGETEDQSANQNRAMSQPAE